MSQQPLTTTDTFPVISIPTDKTWLDTLQPYLPKRKHMYPLTLLFVYGVWFSYMAINGLFGLFEQHAPVSITMTLGSFIAGATAEGGAAVAFPVFTKVLHIPPADARTFGLMIQAVGMTMAGWVIYLNRIPILKSVIVYVTLGGILGQVIGTFWLILPNPYPRILFTFIAATFGVALFVSRYVLKWKPETGFKHWDNSHRFVFVMVGIVGGAFAAQTGSGIDMLTFIVLTLAFGIDEKLSTPTTVIIMGLNSVIGFALHGFIVQDIGVAWDYWLVAIPIVIIGAPLGAVVAARLKRDVIIVALLSLITLEVGTTLWLVPFSMESKIVTIIAMAICALVFCVMLVYRHTHRHDTLSPKAEVTHG